MAKFEDKRMELTEHLAELRTRLMRSILYLVVGTIVAYQFFTPAYNFMYKPLEKEIVRLNAIRSHKAAEERAHEANLGFDPLHGMPPPHNPVTADDLLIRDRVISWMYLHPPTNQPLSGDVFHGFYEPFTVQLTLSLMFGLILVTPLIIQELAMFILPALTPEERKPLRLLMPLSIILLICGCAGRLFHAVLCHALVSLLPGELPNGRDSPAGPQRLHHVLCEDDGGVRHRVPVAGRADDAGASSGW